MRLPRHPNTLLPAKPLNHPSTGTRTAPRAIVDYSYLSNYSLHDTGQRPGSKLLKGLTSMAKRHSIPGRASRRDFTRKAGHVHGKNALPNPMRGGIRL